MLHKFNTYFNQNYPLPVRGKRGLATALCFDLFITFFLFYFRPFGLSNPDSYFSSNPKSILLFGVITLGVLSVFFCVFPYVSPSTFSESRWKIKHQVVFFFAMLFCIATLNGLYINYMEGHSFSWIAYGEIISQTFILGSLPITFLVIITFNVQLKRNLADAQLVQKLVKNKMEITKKKYPISTQLKQNFIVNETTFLYAKADGNYIEVFSTDKCFAIYRLSMRLFEQRLASTLIVRNHRSYMVNLSKIEKVKGNAQGLKLWLTNCEHPVPVSRKYISSIKRQTNGLH